MIKNLRIIFWLGLISSMLFGCAAMKTAPEKPEVSLVGLSLVNAGLFEQTFKVQLRIQNPNNFDLPLQGLNIKLNLNNQPFITAMSNNHVTIPRLGSTIIDVDAISTLTNLTQQFGGFLKGDMAGVRYNLNGHVHLIEPIISLPVEKQGEISLKGIIPGF